MSIPASKELSTLEAFHHVSLGNTWSTDTSLHIEERMMRSATFVVKQQGEIKKFEFYWKPEMACRIHDIVDGGEKKMLSKMSSVTT